MQGAKDGLETDELMNQLDAKIQYGGAQKLTEFEMELLDQIDRMYDTQIDLQTKLKNEKNSNEKKSKKLEETTKAVEEYCTSTTRDKIFLAGGYQFGKEEAEKIMNSKSDKELIEEKGLMELYENEQISMSDADKAKRILNETINRENQSKSLG